MTRTGKVRQLVAKAPEPFIEIHPQDATAREIDDGVLVHVVSRRGTVCVRARVCASVGEGRVFMPFHWGDQFQSNVAANYLTIAATGRVSKEPEFKLCAVEVRAVPATIAEEEYGPTRARTNDTSSRRPDLVSVTEAVT
jgi:anaerobic selenocysteine-containing dehydrogenase